MAYLVKKKIYGKLYAYEYTSIWDKENKKYKKKSKYLGKVDECSGNIIQSKKRKEPEETQIVDYGDTYAINQINKEAGFNELVKKIFSKYHNHILSLMSFKMLDGSAMKNAESWQEGNFAKKLYKNPNITSQNISRILKYLGSEDIKDKFLKEYSRVFLNNKTGLIIDSTSLASSIKTDINDWGYTSNGIKRSIKCLMLVDKVTKLPMYFRSISGNIPDVSILKTSLSDIKNLDLNVSEAIFDAGFYSNENIHYLINEKIDFMIRVPRNRKIFSELLEETNGIESITNATVYGKRAIFIVEKEIEIENKKIFAYIIQDPNKRGKEITKNTILGLDDKNNKVDLDTKKSGYFILLSTIKQKKEDVLPQYYSRQMIEQIFGFSKK